MDDNLPTAGSVSNLKSECQTKQNLVKETTSASLVLTG